jgi:hypothetical protein
MAPCSLAGGHESLSGTCCLHLPVLLVTMRCHSPHNCNLNCHHRGNLESLFTDQHKEGSRRCKRRQRNIPFRWCAFEPKLRVPQHLSANSTSACHDLYRPKCGSTGRAIDPSQPVNEGMMWDKSSSPWWPGICLQRQDETTKYPCQDSLYRQGYQQTVWLRSQLKAASSTAQAVRCTANRNVRM